MLKQWWARAVVGRTSVSDPLQEPERPDARFEAEWRSVIKTRLVVILGMLACWAVGLEARLVYIQVFSHQEYVAKAQLQQQDIVELEAPRGDIVDRNGQLLAYSVGSYDVYANPSFVKDPAAEARELCLAFGDCSSDELAQITAKLSKPKKFILVRSARDMSPDAANGARALITARFKAAKASRIKAEREELDKTAASVSLEPRAWRYYPKFDLAAHVVGFLQTDGKGGAGVESRFNKQVSGVSGRMLVQVDGKTHDMFTRVESAPTPGDSLELTIDVGLQYILERELQAGIRAAGASSGSAIIIDPNTGEILAQASYPTYNPNLLQLPGAVSEDARRNRSVQDTYEPGSTLKIVTASAAINAGVWRPSDLIDTNPGTITIPGRLPIHEDKGHNYGVLSVEDVLVRSSNVGAVQMGLKVGDRLMLDYLRGFGLGQRIAPNFAGESPGQMAGKTVTNSTLASWSMGYEIGVTPIQMATVASVVANGGLLIEPHVLRAVIHNGRRTETEPKIIRRVITPETALTLTGIMEGVVSSPLGTGSAAALARYQVAGKTGTAAKVVNKRYSKQDYYVSFVGFVPSRRPAFTILVVVDSPHKLPAYGGKVAAPIFQRIAAAALEYAGVPPSISPAPPVIVATDRRVLPFTPPPPPVAPVITKIGDRPVMPDLTGMLLRDVVRVTNALGLQMTYEGDGSLVSQSPPPGAILDGSSRGTFRFRRGPIPPARSDR